MGEIRSIAAARADKESDNSLLSPAECCDDVARDIRSGKSACDKLLVLRLQTGNEGGGYNVGFNACNMRLSEMVALLEVAKIEMLKCMGYVTNDLDH
jgi:hypothetical protein